MKREEWNARFQANFAAVATNVNLWGMSGEVIGNTAAGGVGVIAGIVGGQGHFGSPTSLTTFDSQSLSRIQSTKSYS
jgi:hypothetical protein